MPDGRWVLPQVLEEGRMMAPVSRPAVHAGQRGRLWWLPADGHGNGLDDQAWAPVLEITEQVVPQVLSILRDAGVPAYAAPARRPGARLRDPAQAAEGWRLWVGASAHGRAEDALVAVMPQLIRQAARHAGRAWR
jgi:hypothetical protein